MALDIKKLQTQIEEELKAQQNESQFQEVGYILTVGDGICFCYGLKNAMMGEKVVFNSSCFGVIFNLEVDKVGIILLGDIFSIKEGDECRLTGKIFEVPVGEALLGRVVDPLGEPQDGLEKIITTETLPIERPAHAVMERDHVNEPLLTGIGMIDALIPIGKGQRELIIGDRQTGKTSIAIDTILNQQGKNVICVYTAIGQKQQTVAQIRKTLEEHNALEYTIIVSAPAHKEGTLQYLAPFSACSMAEYFAERGRDVLIVYDDLSKHAVAYRELSLLLKRPPGREAFPGDIFYLHSRLLERSAKLSKVLGGGSLTALPIIETKAGDISAYIPTNVISITDGQIFLETELFYKGIRPAINSGLSVSRVGGSAQFKAVKRVSGLLRIFLASYKELESFSQFGSDLDELSLKKLARGRLVIEIFKQNIHELIDFTTLACVLWALNRELLDDIPLEKVKIFVNFVSKFLQSEETGKAVYKVISETKDFPEDRLMSELILKIKKVL